jgi:hypothetical protein
MTGVPLDSVPLWAMFVVELAIGWAALEAGYRMGRWRHAVTADEKDAPVGAMVAAILGLVAFMLAFTFSLAASRFDAKRQTVLEEANAIGTTYLRTRLLPEPQKTETAKLLRNYVDVRIRGVQEGNVAEAIAESEKLQEQIWQQAVAAADKDHGSIMTGLFVQSLNEMIDVHAKRLLAGLRGRIPLTIWVALFSLSALGIGSMGYQSGLSGTRRSPAMLALVVAFAGALFLIVDLDRGREGFLNVDQTAMTDLQRSMQASQTP